MAEIETKPTAEVSEEENKTEKATEEAEVKATEVDAEKEEPKEPENIYDEQLPNRVIVARNHPLSYYLDRARRILRMEETLFVNGRGDTVSVACTLVEVLKRQKLGVISSISTGMHIEPFFNAIGDTQWAQPTSMISFNLVRGELAQFVSDYKQRKVIEIFEKKDSEQKGILTLDAIESLEFAEKFKANKEQIEASKEFLAKECDGNVNLPNFIKYASILIHPLLKDGVFTNIIEGTESTAPQDRNNF